MVSGEIVPVEGMQPEVHGNREPRRIRYSVAAFHFLKDKRMDDLFYKPHVEPTRDYHSNAVILHERVTNVPETSDTPEHPLTQTVRDLEETVDKLLQVRQITTLLPEQIVKTIDYILDTLIFQAEVEKDEIITIIENDPPAPETPEDPEGGIIKPAYDKSYPIKENNDELDNEEDTVWPEMIGSGFNFEVVPAKNIWELANEQYLQDSCAIKKLFVNEYNGYLESYIYQLMTTMDEAGVSVPETLNVAFEGETVSGIGTEYQHLSDLIVRNQIALNEMTGLFQKTHDSYTTNSILTAWDIASQTRIRYLKERYSSTAAANYIEMCDKNLLQASRDTYEDRYVQTRNEVYRFLHSAAVLSGDMLNLHLASNLAKCSLLKKGVNIFAKKEYANEQFENTTSTKLDNLEDKARAAVGGNTTVTSGTITNSTTSNSNTASDGTSTGTTNKETKTPQAKDTIAPSTNIISNQESKSNGIDITKLVVGGGIGGSVKNSGNDLFGINKVLKDSVDNINKAVSSKIDTEIKNATTAVNTYLNNKVDLSFVKNNTKKAASGEIKNSGKTAKAAQTDPTKEKEKKGQGV